MLIRWVHPMQVEHDTGKLKPTAFPLEQLVRLHSSSAPSVIIKRFIDASNVEVAKTKACSYCISRIEKDKVWEDVKNCKCRMYQCKEYLYGARAATAKQTTVVNHSFFLDGSEHSLDIVERASTKNPGHALVQSDPRTTTPLPGMICMELQEFLITVFDQISTVEQALALDI